MHPKLSPRHQSQREPSEEDHENEEEDSDGYESSEDGTVEEMDKCDGGCECRAAQSFCWYHRSMVQQVSKTRSSLEEAEKAGTAEPELKLHLNVDETAIEMGLIPRSWSTDGNYDLGMYRLYLVDDSFKLTEDDQDRLVQFIELVWPPCGYLKHDWVGGYLRDDDLEYVWCDEIPEFPCPRVASTTPIHLTSGIEIVFLSKDHIEVILDTRMACFERPTPAEAPEKLKFVGIHQYRPFSHISDSGSEGYSDEEMYIRY
ncbi:hypothetical protein NPX13_g8977 [Xylaria arbuscula]|uniref:Uncharacterized protein n=1 Tax=Xylaria arbuscula TaxID=114810 RepID=A0A9W8N787_9PEZI|nr:hypothetical protein NPX13_g8977 [Xylaria arbuscula]